MMDVVRASVGEHADRVRCFGQLERGSWVPVVAHALAVALPSRLGNLTDARIKAKGMDKVGMATRGLSFEQLIDDGENGFCVV